MLWHWAICTIIIRLPIVWHFKRFVISKYFSGSCTVAVFLIHIKYNQKETVPKNSNEVAFVFNWVSGQYDTSTSGGGSGNTTIEEPKEEPKEEVKKLVTEGETGLIRGFKSKKGNNFDAYLKYNKQGNKMEFEFNKR